MSYKYYCLVCGCERCDEAGSNIVFKALKLAVATKGLDEKVQLVKSGSLGLCHKGIGIKILPDGLIYTGITPEDAEVIVGEHLDKDKPVKNLLYKQNERVHTTDWRKQYRIVLRNCGKIDPENIDEYIARQGYVGLEKVLFELTTEQVLEELKTSGLRGRGGAGFPTWLKWKLSADIKSDEKYVVCNADEGDPGAYMDRSVLEGDPHSVLEAMAIAARTVGAHRGVIYIRAEYPLAIERLNLAIEQAKVYGLLGKDILGSGFEFDIELRLGAGAFVCGEETALLASIEGERGMPKPKPPYPANKGLFAKPTVINNVETLANIPIILVRGGTWYRSIGTENSPGTKVFALTGKIQHSGLIEVPMGITLREIIYEIGGGILDGKELKAVQTGGPSGGVITPEYLDTPIDFDSLKMIGSMMGSGGMIVLDEEDCIVDVTKFYMEFCVEESCGKCAPCRVGTRKMHQILDRITRGKGTMEDIANLKDIGLATQKASLCGLGQTAANPVLSTIRYFNDEYIEHVKNRRCRSCTCKDLVTYTIDAEICIGCTVCAKKCPVSCISGERKTAHIIDQSKCIKCGECHKACKFDAVKIA